MRQLPGLAAIGGEEFESLLKEGQASSRPDPGQARPGTALHCAAAAGGRTMAGDMALGAASLHAVAVLGD
ncbi:hypothetical protein CPLU01_04307 [Colletotrichum plurivorum]|uniref:Uncharacterized protein n=1 Tax=Colletotrichum plurivorum TaxID=2175906 RepID=A0A8H6KR48_9PEZI|nr:hypothetical protein CPLU01_04307 [Colletotrichum plurivorum]